MAPVVLGLVLAASATELPAQVVRGTVTDATSDSRLTGVAVTLVDEQGRPSVRTSTDSAGWFALRAPRPGRYRVQLAFLSYAPFTSDPLELNGNLITQLALRMGRDAIPLSPVVVVARSSNRLADFELRRARHAAGHFITQDQIERRPLARPTTVLLDVPGVTLQAVGRRGNAPDDRNIILLSGGSSRLCVANVFIDGVAASQSPATVDERLDAGSIAAVEVYARAAGAPPEFQRGNTCGSVLFWTREAEKHTGRRNWLHIGIAAGVLTLGFLITR